jgi:hypothetical protein
MFGRGTFDTLNGAQYSQLTVVRWHLIISVAREKEK